MKKILIAVAAASMALCAGACGSTPDAPQSIDTGKKPDVGTLSLALIGADDQGTQYRLRHATFQISAYGYYPYYPYPSVGGASGAFDGGAYSDPNVTTVSSETHPDDPTISTPLTPGDYTVTLVNDDWYLERLAPTGPEVVPESVLLSDRTQYAHIYDRGVSDVSFRFGAGGKLIDFRRGDLHITIQVERPSVCGNGIIEGTEQCDGSNLQGQTCATMTMGAATGTLACNSACGYDTSGCTYTWNTGGFTGTGAAPGIDGGFPSGSGGAASSGGSKP